MFHAWHRWVKVDVTITSVTVFWPLDSIWLIVWRCHSSNVTCERNHTDLLPQWSMPSKVFREVHADERSVRTNKKPWHQARAMNGPLGLSGPPPVIFVPPHFFSVYKHPNAHLNSLQQDKAKDCETAFQLKNWGFVKERHHLIKLRSFTLQVTRRVPFHHVNFGCFIQ